MLVAVFSAVTLTFGTAAPEGSITVPVMAPVVVCASAAEAKHASAIKNARILELLTIELPPLRALVGQLGKLRRGLHPQHGPIGNRPAGYQPALQLQPPNACGPASGG